MRGRFRAGLKHLAEDLFLRCEVAVERPDAGIGEFRDLLNGGLFVAVAVEEVRCGLDDRLASAGFAALEAAGLRRVRRSGHRISVPKWDSTSNTAEARLDYEQSTANGW